MKGLKRLRNYVWAHIMTQTVAFLHLTVNTHFNWVLITLPFLHKKKKKKGIWSARGAQTTTQTVAFLHLTVSTRFNWKFVKLLFPWTKPKQGFKCLRSYVWACIMTQTVAFLHLTVNTHFTWISECSLNFPFCANKTNEGFEALEELCMNTHNDTQTVALLQLTVNTHFNWMLIKLPFLHKQNR